MAKPHTDFVSLSAALACLLQLSGPASAENTQAQSAMAKRELAQLNHDIESISQNGKINPAARTQFVVGNKVWSPGRKFANAKDWLALACHAGGCSLISAELKVSLENVPATDDYAASSGQLLNFKTAAPADARIVAWFKSSAGTPWLKAGNVPSYFSGIARPNQTRYDDWNIRLDLTNGDHVTLVPLLLSSKYSPTLATDFDSSGSNTPHFLLQLRASGMRQMLPGELGSCDSPALNRNYLLWAGDLDGDGKPDYLVRFGGEDSPAQLYLSSSAKPGQLVGLAGMYIPPPSDAECEGSEPEL